MTVPSTPPHSPRTPKLVHSRNLFRERKHAWLITNGLWAFFGTLLLGWSISFVWRDFDLPMLIPAALPGSFAALFFYNVWFNYQELQTFKPTDTYTIVIDRGILSAAVNYARYCPPKKWYLPHVGLYWEEGDPNFSVEITQIKTFETYCPTMEDAADAYRLRLQDGNFYWVIGEAAFQAVRTELKDIPHVRTSTW